MKVTSHSLTETEAVAATWLATVSAGKKAVVVGLYGNLGSGKTAFTQAVAKLLGITSTVTSPTYVIEKIYTIPQIANTFPTGFKQLIHIDAYRLEKAAELARLGWDGIINDSQNLILVEWPERVAEIMPEGHIRLKFTFIDEATREIEN